MTPERVATLERDLAAAKAHYAELLRAAKPFIDLCELASKWSDTDRISVSVLSGDCGLRIGLLALGDLRRLAQVASLKQSATR